MKSQTERYDILIIGSGPAGKSAAIQAAKLGHRTAIVDAQSQIGGVCVHTGTVPSKTLRETVLNLSGWRERGFYGHSYRVKKDITASDLMQRLDLTLQREVDIFEHQLHRNRVEILHGFASFVNKTTVEIKTIAGDSQLVKAKRFIIAVGTRTYRPDNIPFDGVSIIDTDEVLNMKDLPRSLTVVGAGVIGVEYATIFQALDVAVTLVEPRDSMLDFIDKEIIQYFQHDLSENGLRLQFGQKVGEVKKRAKGGVVVKLENGRAIASEVVLFAAGRVGATDKLGLDQVSIDVDHRGRIAVNEHFQTSVKNIYACGDVIGFPSLASTALEQGRFATLHAFAQPVQSASEYFPYGIYSVPEISSVGMTEEEVIKKGIPYEVGIAPLSETSRGRVMGLQSGMMKSIFSLKTRRLLGVHIVGEGATELIHIGQAVLTLKGSLDYFLENAFNYPTLAEAYKVAALHAHNRIVASLD